MRLQFIHRIIESKAVCAIQAANHNQNKTGFGFNTLDRPRTFVKDDTDLFIYHDHTVPAIKRLELFWKTFKIRLE